MAHGHGKFEGGVKTNFSRSEQILKQALLPHQLIFFNAGDLYKNVRLSSSYDTKDDLELGIRSTMGHDNIILIIA